MHRQISPEPNQGFTGARQHLAYPLGSSPHHRARTMSFMLTRGTSLPSSHNRKRYDAFTMPRSIGRQSEIELHKEHRRLTNTFWSRSSMLSLESVMNEKNLKLVKKIQAMVTKDPSINIVKALRYSSHNLLPVQGWKNILT